MLDLIYGEVVLREEDGESPELEEYLRRFPQYAGELRAQFEVHTALQSGQAFTLELSSASFDLDNPGASTGAREAGNKWPESHRPQPCPISPSPCEPLPSENLSNRPGPRSGAMRYRPCLGAAEWAPSIGLTTAMPAPSRIEGHEPCQCRDDLRFKREFRSLLGVAHPNLVTLYELIFDGKNWFLTMELLEGVNFLQYVRGEVDMVNSASTTTQDEPAAHSVRLREATRQLATGIAWLHAAGKLHRDIKPTNVIVTRDGRVVLLDFGLAVEQGFDGRHQSTEQHILGTAAYMAPEQAVGLPISSAADWYSVGVMLFEALTGRVPFLGTALSVLLDKQTSDPPSPSDLASDVPDDLNALCVDLLRRPPEERPSAPDVMRRLGSEDPDQKPFSRPDAPVFDRPSSRLSQGLALVGPARHQQILDQALAEMLGGQSVVFYLHGPSGAGKTALLTNFLDQRIRRADAVVLAGRCYERESVPYKALDSLIDSLGRHLRSLPEAEVAAVLPATWSRSFGCFRGFARLKHTPMRRGGLSRPRIHKNCAAAPFRHSVSCWPG